MRIQKVGKKLLVTAVLMTMIYAVSCSPTATGEDANSLNVLKSKSGKLTKVSDTNAYSIALQCGCPFPMKVEGADSSKIRYVTNDLGSTINVHTVKATPIAPLMSGTYIGWIAIVTIPPTVETFRDTLRDTLVVP